MTWLPDLDFEYQILHSEYNFESQNRDYLSEQWVFVNAHPPGNG